MGLLCCLFNGILHAEIECGLRIGISQIRFETTRLSIKQ